MAITLYGICQCPNILTFNILTYKNIRTYIYYITLWPWYVPMLYKGLPSPVLLLWRMNCFIRIWCFINYLLVKIDKIITKNYIGMNNQYSKYLVNHFSLRILKSHVHQKCTWRLLILPSIVDIKVGWKCNRFVKFLNLDLNPSSACAYKHGTRLARSFHISQNLPRYTSRDWHKLYYVFD